LTPQVFTSSGYNIYPSSLANNHEFGTAFLVNSKFNHMVKNFTPINERLCVVRIKGREGQESISMRPKVSLHHQPQSKDEKYKKLEETIQRVETKTIRNKQIKSGLTRSVQR
jgi:hypothetical protein